MTEKISVIVPVYMVEQYLEKCIDSILAQTYKDLEILLIDDGSPDNCPAICDRYAEKDERISVIHKMNGGLSEARNAGIELMSGEYVFFVDSDDYLPPDAVESLYEAIVREKADIAIGNITEVHPDGSSGVLYEAPADKYLFEKADFIELLGQPCSPSKLYRSTLFTGIRFPVGLIYEDFFVWHQVLSEADKVVLTGKTSYYYYIREGSITHSGYRPETADIVFALESRSLWFESIGRNDLAQETMMFIYARTAVAFANLDRKDPAQAEKLKAVKRVYDRCYRKLIKSSGISRKQLLRLYMLKNNPGVHTLLFGRKMPIDL